MQKIEPWVNLGLVWSWCGCDRGAPITILSLLCNPNPNPNPPISTCPSSDADSASERHSIPTPSLARLSPNKFLTFASQFGALWPFNINPRVRCSEKNNNNNNNKKKLNSCLLCWSFLVFFSQWIPRLASWRWIQLRDTYEYVLYSCILFCLLYCIWFLGIINFFFFFFFGLYLLQYDEMLGKGAFKTVYGCLSIYTFSVFCSLAFVCFSLNLSLICCFIV